MNPTPTLSEALLEQARKRADALIRKDTEAIRALLSADFRFTGVTGTTYDRESYIASFVSDPSVRWTEQTLEIEHTFPFWNGAIAVGVVTDKAQIGEKQIDARFRATQAYAWSGSGWVYLVGHASAISA